MKDCRGHGFHPWWGNKDSAGRAVRPKKKKKKSQPPRSFPFFPPNPGEAGALQQWGFHGALWGAVLGSEVERLLPQTPAPKAPPAPS